MPTGIDLSCDLMRRRIAIASATLLMLLLALTTITGWDWIINLMKAPPGQSEGYGPAAVGEFVGRQVCADCHPKEHRLWQESHHDLAMQAATESTVLGNFESAAFNYAGITSTFFKRDNKFFVRTDGPEGKLQEYEIAYTFGAVPLQQYLIEFPGGRYQALSICWDTRPSEEGGQHWFHLYPDEEVTHEDPLHWTGLYHNWNHMCAECHSTNVRKNYSLEEDRFETNWSEIDVSCESCHGPGSRHVKWAETAQAGGVSQEDAGVGLFVQLKDNDEAVWSFVGDTGIAKRSKPRRSHIQVETCGRCHSRRSLLHEDYVHGQPLMDTHRPTLLRELLYHADGQVLDEVYVYGSFLQSKMYHEGVTCSDCHDPHSLRPYGSGNRVCAGCHLPETFDTPAHHFHKSDSRGASCVECHMPSQNYMVVDPRRDHSLRIPRPDLSLRIGAPNACNGCHADRSFAWAANAVTKWYGTKVAREPHFGEALYKGWSGSADAEPALIALAEDPAMPSIARASALSLLPRYATRPSLQTIQQALKSEHSLLRISALSALEVVDPRDRIGMAFSLLEDPIRALRLEAVRVLAAVPSDLWSATQRSVFERALTEYLESQRVNADRPESHLRLGIVYQGLGRLEAAEKAYETALKVDSSFVGAYINLADLFRMQERDKEGAQILGEALAIDPNHADVHHALGLLRVRQKRHGEALRSLERAAQLRPNYPRYSYVFAVGLHSTGATDRALEVLKAAHQRNPADRELLLALITINRERGRVEDAATYARKLLQLSPQDPTARQIMEVLRGVDVPQ